ncbi:MAG: 3-dehydroquinate synthase [Alphaproteobacteria bacterium]|nr:3-dehydroquinate synthase [Alphaproteobacteria bacterium]
MSVFGSVRLGLGDRAYDVVVGRGLLAEAERHIAPLLARPRVAVVTDSNVERLHLETLTQALARGGIAATAIVLPAGEETKSFAHLEKLLDKLLDARIERTDTILALGGGVVGDITGFAAATLRRGTPVVQVPTTLLAQVDAAIGGKTGIDTRHGKNLIGAFHQPRLVLSDVATLDTLPRRELLAGYAEVVKYGLLGDGRFFEWLEQNGRLVITGDVAARSYAVLTSARMKAEIVQSDERESGARALLNLGHTFAHALETELGYDGRLLHGEAVASGLVLAFELSQRLGLVGAADTARVRRHLAQIGLPAGLPAAAPAKGWDPRVLLDHMRQDKKVKGGTLTFILVKAIGKAFVSREIGESDVLGVLDAELAA